jgi:hypothetical protein
VTTEEQVQDQVMKELILSGMRWNTNSNSPNWEFMILYICTV